VKAGRRPPPNPGESITYHPRAAGSVDWATKVKAVIWASTPRASHWWARVGREFVEVYRRESSWFESPTAGKPPTPRRKKPPAVPAGSVPLFDSDQLLPASLARSA
jgi:hypothetical protein